MQTIDSPFCDDQIALLRLIRSENVGPVTCRRLIDRFGSAEEALRELPGLARRGGGRRIRVCSRAAAEKEIETGHRIGADLITFGDPRYPPLLTRTEDAPPLLYVHGQIGLLGKRAIAVVGARNASLNGLRLAERLARDLGTGGLLVVSGMARGIDAAAHRGALGSGTVAVLAGGVDHVYPKENKGLYDQLRETGAVISEMPPGTVPQARHFPKRNRIISGMARGVLVVEAAPRSGSLITARLALEQDREVFAVPGSPLDARARGANDLLRQGAQLIESAEEILDCLRDITRAPRIVPTEAPAPPEPPAPADPKETDSARRRIVNFLGPVPVTVDEIIRQCQFSPSAVSTALLELELSDRLERHPGNRVSLIQEG